MPRGLLDELPDAILAILVLRIRWTQEPKIMMVTG